MEELGCNWNESLANREEILVLINPMYLDWHFNLQLPPAAEMEEKIFILSI